MVRSGWSRLRGTGRSRWWWRSRSVWRRPPARQCVVLRVEPELPDASIDLRLDVLVAPVVAHGQVELHHHYRYDDRGNLTRQEATGSQVNDHTRTQAYDLDNALLVADGDHTPDCNAAASGVETFAYDAAGNMTARGEMELTYSLRGHTVEITPPGLPAIGMKYTDATQDRRILAGNTRMATTRDPANDTDPNGLHSIPWPAQQECLTRDAALSTLGGAAAGATATGDHGWWGASRDGSRGRGWFRCLWRAEGSSIESWAGSVCDEE